MRSTSLNVHCARAVAAAGLILGCTSAASVAAQAEEISPACGDYHPNVIVVDGMVRKPSTLTVAQLAALPDQQTLRISFLDRLNNTQNHTEHGPLLWTVLTLGAGGVEVDKLLDEQYQGPNPYITLYVMVIATNGYQTLVSESEIDPEYGNAPVLVSLTEDGVPMTQAPYANTSKAPAQLVVPGDQRGGRYANRICRIVVMNGAVGPAATQLLADG